MCWKVVGLISGLERTELGTETPASRPPATTTEREGAPGRYVVLDRLGQGGMGVVHRAYDRELDRRVALKLLHAGVSGGELRSRLQREAQAMARVAHPNVVTVHDVGELGGQLFVAMELVDGVTLERWMSEQRGWREVVAVLLQAGRGLEAAHAAGLVHRDFKPQNVMVGADGRVRVMDFGLARAGDGGDASSLPTLPPAGALLGQPLTQHGAMMGTPAYMSPEQMLGKPADARSDQFSFCVSAYEALYGRRPYAAATMTELQKRLFAGRPDDPPRSRVPRSVWRALLPGLSIDPDQRYATLRELLDRLARILARRRALRVAAPVLAVVLASIGTGAVLASRRAQLCEGGAQKLAGVWGESRRAQVSAAFSATPLGGAVVKTVTSGLDAYARRWSERHGEACRATRLRGEQSEELLDLRTHCLDRRLNELRETVELLAAADADLVLRGAELVGSLAPVEGCDDVVALRARQKPAAAVRDRVAALEVQIARAKALREAARLADARVIAERAVAEATAVGYGPTLAEAQLELALVTQKQGDARTAENGLYEAAWRATASRDDELAARAWVELVWNLGSAQRRRAEARRLLGTASSAVARLGSSQVLEGILYNHRGSLERAEGLGVDAVASFKRSIELKERALGPRDVSVAHSLLNLGGLYQSLGQLPEAWATNLRALEIYRGALGETHPHVAAALSNLGATALKRGDRAMALDQHRQALAIREALLGPEHPESAISYYNLAAIARQERRFKDARTLLERALRIRERAIGPDSEIVAWTRLQLAELALDEDRAADALEEAHRARAALEKSLGPVDPRLGEVLVAEGRALLGARRWAEARPILERARSLYPEDHPQRARISSLLTSRSPR